MTGILLVIPGPPQAQGRPRFFRRGNTVGTYDPQKSRDFKSKIAFYASKMGLKPFRGPIVLTLDLYIKRPQARCRQIDPGGPLKCFKRPDADNYLKATLDGLNGIGYFDDGQVQDARVRKWYHEKDGAPRVEIRIEHEETPCESSAPKKITKS